jgi:hypothetical protein
MSPPDPNESRPDLSMGAILPALTSFQYGGDFKYLENFLAQINTPRLYNLRIICFMPPQLSQFINRTESLKLNRFRRAEVTFDHQHIHIRLDCSQGECRQAQLSMDIDILGIPSLDEQIPCVTNMIGQIIRMLSNVDHLAAHGENVGPREM